MISISALVSRLSGKVPARNGVPSNDQYTQAIKDSVGYFSRDASREKIAILGVTSGTASYALPADFIRMIELSSLSNPSRIFINNDGIVPLGGLPERYTIAGDTITFYPTPAYTLEREYRYAAGWALTADDYDDYYADMTEAEASVVLLKAQSECLATQMNAVSGGVVRYRIGDEEYDKGAGLNSLQSRIESLERQYERAVASYRNRWSMSVQWQS